MKAYRVAVCYLYRDWEYDMDSLCDDYENIEVKFFFEETNALNTFYKYVDKYKKERPNNNNYFSPKTGAERRFIIEPSGRGENDGVYIYYGEIEIK